MPLQSFVSGSSGSCSGRDWGQNGWQELGAGAREVVDLLVFGRAVVSVACPAPAPPPPQIATGVSVFLPPLSSHQPLPFLLSPFFSPLHPLHRICITHLPLPFESESPWGSLAVPVALLPTVSSAALLVPPLAQHLHLPPSRRFSN